MVSEREKPHWVYRLENYKKAFALLKEAIELLQKGELNQLAQEGLIQRFEFTLELAWKCQKDYLEAMGVILQTVTPISVVRSAFESGLINNGDTWMQAIQARNMMSHVYDATEFETVMHSIQSKYYPILSAFHATMLKFEAEHAAQQ